VNIQIPMSALYPFIPLGIPTLVFTNLEIMEKILTRLVKNLEGAADSAIIEALEHGALYLGANTASCYLNNWFPSDIKSKYTLRFVMPGSEDVHMIRI